MFLSSLKELFSSAVPRDLHDLAQAKNLMNSTQYEPALDLLDTLIERSPDSSGAWLHRGMLKRKMANPRDAIADLARALELGGELGV